MVSLIPEADLQRSREKYFAEHPTPAQLLVRTAKANPDATTAELALIVSHSRSWVRRTLKANGMQAARVRKEKKEK
jgi:hypothetical protein